MLAPCSSHISSNSGIVALNLESNSKGVLLPRCKGNHLIFESIQAFEHFQPLYPFQFVYQFIPFSVGHHACVMIPGPEGRRKACTISKRVSLVI